MLYLSIALNGPENFPSASDLFGKEIRSTWKVLKCGVGLIA
jgi:hypothetical protein